MRIFTTIANLLFCGVLGGVASQNSLAQTQKRLNPKIPAPIRAKYTAIRDAQYWLNPKITIRAEGIAVVSRGLPLGGKTVATSELRGLLLSLPVSAWPYGRVVLASDTGIGRGDGSDIEPIKRNHIAAEKVLKKLNVEMDWWPSA